MSINFKKIKSQIKPFKSEAKHKGYIFLATDEQKKNGIDSIAKNGSKRSLLDILVYFVQTDEDYCEEFAINPTRYAYHRLSR